MALPVIHSDEPLRHVESKFQSVHVTLIFVLSARKWCCQLHMQLKAFPPNLVYTIFRSEIMDVNRQTAAISNTTRGNLEFFRDQKSAISSEQEGLRISCLVYRWSIMTCITHVPVSSNLKALVCFVCLGFNGIFSTNRLRLLAGCCTRRLNQV